MRPVLFVCVLCLAALACSGFSTPATESPAQPQTDAPPPTTVPTGKPVQPTDTPAPTAIPTSAPLLLNDELFEANIKDDCETDVPINAYENGVFSIGGGQVAFMNGQLAVWCYGARHQWIGTIDYEGYIFASDENDPMQFEIVKDAGYRFVGGIGTLTYPDGKQIALYRPTQGQAADPAEIQNDISFRENFTTSLQPGWEWRSENASRWEITSGGWLKIAGEDASLLANGRQSNLLCRSAPDGDFQVTTHISANPTSDFQQATLYLYQDGENFTAINRGYCGPCETNGSGIFMEYKVTGGWDAFNVKTRDTDVYLRLTSQGNTITGYYAFDEEKWQRLGDIKRSFDITKICLGVSNVDSAGIDADLVGEFDYLEVSVP